MKSTTLFGALAVVLVATTLFTGSAQASTTANGLKTINGFHMNGLKTINGFAMNGFHMNGLKTINGFAMNGFHMNGLKTINGFAMNGFHMNGLKTINGWWMNGLTLGLVLPAERAAIWGANGIDPSRPLSQVATSN
jgi:hypothetical protein